jgi:hypothetical protein
MLPTASAGRLTSRALARGVAASDGAPALFPALALRGESGGEVGLCCGREPGAFPFPFAPPPPLLVVLARPPLRLVVILVMARPPWRLGALRRETTSVHGPAAPTRGDSAATAVGSEVSAGAGAEAEVSERVLVIIPGVARGKDSHQHRNPPQSSEEDIGRKKVKTDSTSAPGRRC